MEKIKKWLSDYKKKSSRLKIVGDIIFYAFIILMIIPVTRREISSFLIKATLMKPTLENKESELTTDDYQLTIQEINSNRAVQLSEYKGEVILLNFWATWCPPCRAEMPSLQKLYNDYSDKVKFILVSNEENSAIENYFDEFGYTMPVYLQRSVLPPSFSVSSIPTTYLIGRNGRIIVRKTGAAKWDSEKFRAQLDEIIAR